MAILELNGHIVRIRLLQWVVVCRVDHEIAAALGVARVGEQGNYRPPRRPEENGQASLLALEAAWGAFGQAPLQIARGGLREGVVMRAFDGRS